MFWIFFLSVPHRDDEKVRTSFFAEFALYPTAHIFLTDVIPLALSYFCTFAAIHLNGYVGILDCDNMDEIYVRKRKGGQIRTQTQQDAYKLDLEDPDRELDCSDNKLDQQDPDRQLDCSRYEVEERNSNVQVLCPPGASSSSQKSGRNAVLIFVQRRLL